MLKLSLYEVYPASILDGLHYYISNLIYYSNVDNFTMALIPLCIINKKNIKMFSTSQKSQMKLDPNWITGFVDGEGCFSVLFQKSLTHKVG